MNSHFCWRPHWRCKPLPYSSSLKVLSLIACGEFRAMKNSSRKAGLVKTELDLAQGAVRRQRLGRIALDHRREDRGWGATKSPLIHPIHFVFRTIDKTESIMNSPQNLRNLAWTLIRQAKAFKRLGQLDLARSLAQRGLTLKALAWSQHAELVPINTNQRRF